MAKYKVNSKIQFANAIASEGVHDPIAVTPPLPTMDDYVEALRDMHEEKLSLGNIKDFYALTAFASIYTKVSSKLKSVINAVDGMRNFYLVEVILSQMADDALSPSVNNEEIVRFSSSNEVIQKELDQLKKRIGLDQLIENIAPDILAYGEYTLKTKIGKIPEDKEDQLNKGKKRRGKKFKAKRSGNGIEDVTDIVDQGTVISLTQDGNIEGYLVLNEENNKVEVKETADYVKFSLGGQRVRIDLKNVLPYHLMRGNKKLKDILDTIPRFIRIGKSVLYPVLSKLKELELLEKLIPATKLNKLSQGNLVGMPLPENYDLELALKAVRRVEGMINKKVSIDPTNREITVESILSAAGKTRVVPLLGEKGRLEKLDYKSDEPDDLLGNTKEIRELILDSVGVPSELVYKSEGDSKAEVLKRYAKYLRKLKRLQKAIADGCKQIAFIHLANRGVQFKEEEVEVVFNNTLIEIDNLDRLEHADVTTNLLSNVRDYFNDMAEEDSPYRDMVDLNKVAAYMEQNLATVGLSDAIKLPKEGGPDAEKDNLDVDGIDSEGKPTKTEEPEPAPEEDDGKDLEKEEK